MDLIADKNEHDKDDKKRNSRSSNDFTDNKNHEDDSHNENEEPEGMISGYTFISVLVDLLDDEVSKYYCYYKTNRKITDGSYYIKRQCAIISQRLLKIEMKYILRTKWIC